MTDITDMGGRVALVTGAGQGVGRQVALQLATAQNSGGVVVNDYVLDRAEAVAEEIRALGGKAIAAQADVSDLASVKAMVAKGAAELGTIGILVNNVSGGYYARIIDSIESEARRRNVFTLINCGNHDCEDVMEAALRLSSRQCDAIIASVPFMDDEGLQRFLAMQPNAVLLNCISALHRERSLAHVSNQLAG